MAMTIPPKGDADKRIGAQFAPLSVTAQDIPNMTVKVRAGGFWNAEGQYVEYSGGNSVTIVRPITLAKLVVIALNASGALQLYDGAASNNPQLPVLPKTVLPLAAIYVGDSTTEITDQAIFDLRPLYAVSREQVANLDQELANRPTYTDMNDALEDKADNDGTIDLEFTLNKDFVGGVPTQNAVLYVKRGALANVGIRWNEIADRWEFTNDGTNWLEIGTSTYPAHTHPAADIVDFGSAVDARIGASSINLLADVVLSAPVNKHVLVHNGSMFVNRLLAVADISGLDLSLYALTGHTHNIADTIGLQVALDGKAGLTHSHTIAQIADFTSVGPANRHVLVYNGTTSTYSNRALTKADVSDFIEANYVHTTGAETIAGNKTFTGVTTLSGGLTLAPNGLTLGADLVVDPALATWQVSLGDVGAGGDPGLEVTRALGPKAVLYWDESGSTWVAGVEGNVQPVGIPTNLADYYTKAQSDARYALLTHTHTKAQISDFVESAYVHTVGAETVAGAKTFSDTMVVNADVTITGSLTVSGPNASVLADQLHVKDKIVEINYGEAGAGVGGAVPANAGFEIKRGSLPDALLFWEEVSDTWQIGVTGNVSEISVAGHTHDWTQINNRNAGVTGVVNTLSVGEHSDVALSGPVAGQVLRYNGTNFVNATLTSADISNFATAVTSELGNNSVDALQDVMITMPVNGHAFMYDGTKWANRLLFKADISNFVETDYVLTGGSVAQTVTGVKTFSNNANFGGDVVITGDLTVQGTTTTVNTQDMVVEDNLIILNANETGAGVSAGNSGLEVERGTLPNALLVWDELDARWRAGITGNMLGISRDGHAHVVTDITDLTASATELNYCDGVTSPIQNQIDSKIGRAGDAMNPAANLLFAAGGQVLGLPAVPAATGASSKEYVDTSIAGVNSTLSTHMSDDTRHLTVVQDALLDGLAPTLTAAELNYVDGVTSPIQTQLNTVSSNLATHAADASLHLTVAQDALLDGLAPTLTAAELNYVDGVTSPIQTQFNTLTSNLSTHMSDDTRHLTVAQDALLDGLAPTLTAAELNYVDGVTSPIQTQLNTISSNLSTHAADASLHLTVAQNTFLDGLNLPTLTAAEVNQLVGVHTFETVQAQIDSKVNRVSGPVVGNFASLIVGGHIADSGYAAASFAPAVHTHSSGQITDFTAQVNTLISTYVGPLAVVLDNLNDVVIAGPPIVGDVLRHNGSQWTNVQLIKGHITDFVETDYVHKTGIEAIAGDKTFNNNVTVQGNLTVNGTTTTVNSSNLVVTDKNITLNQGYVGPPIGANDAGLWVVRDGANPTANLVWDETVQRWKGGLSGGTVAFSLEGHTHTSANITDFTEAAQDAVGAAITAGTKTNITVTYDDLNNRVDFTVNRSTFHPDYALVVGTGVAAYVLPFTFSVPAIGKASLQVFVNGIKQVEGAAKAYTVTAPNIVTFNAGSIPAVSDDVEFYGFG